VAGDEDGEDQEDGPSKIRPAVVSRGQEKLGRSTTEVCLTADPCELLIDLCNSYICGTALHLCISAGWMFNSLIFLEECIWLR